MHIIKPTLLAVALAAAAPGLAHADEPSLELYGTIDLGLTSDSGVAVAGDPTASTRVTGLSSGVGSASAVGIRGTEPLGQGMAAHFVAETGFCAAGSNQAGAASNPYCSGDGFMQRQVFVGLTGGAFGEFRFGKQGTLVDAQDAVIDPFGNSYAGAFNNLSPVGVNATGNGLVRLNQAATWLAPRYAGFGGGAQYSFNSGSASEQILANESKPTAWQADLNYAAGRLVAGANYARYNNSVQLVPDGPNSGDYRLWTAYGAWDFDVARLSAVYQHGQAGGGRGNEAAWSVGLKIPVGPGKIMASYTERNTSVNAPGGPAVGTSTAHQYAIGYAYDMSRRTQLYASYATIANASASGNTLGTAYAVGVSGNDLIGVTGQRADGIAIGITHHF